MNLSFEMQGVDTFLICQLGQEESIDNTTLHMLTANRILGLAETLFMQFDGVITLKYKITSKISLSQLFTSFVNKQRLLAIFMGITEGILSAEEYMIDISNFYLRPDYIFMDLTTNTIEMICIPLEGAQNDIQNLRDFFKNILFRIHVDPSENRDYVAQLMDALGDMGIFSLPGFQKVLKEISTAKQTNSSKMPVISSPPQRGPMVHDPVPYTDKGSQVFSGEQNVKKSVIPGANVSQGINIPQGVSVPQGVNTPSGFHIPGSTDTAPNTTQDPKMSLLQLLMHYNPENKKIYDQQKKNAIAPKEVNQKTVKQKTVKQKQTSKTAAKNKIVQGQPAAPFAVPGQPAAPFAVPGQPAAPFAVPGQSAAPFPAPGQSAAPFPTPGQSAPQPLYSGMESHPQVPYMPVRASEDHFGETIYQSEYGGDDAEATAFLGEGTGHNTRIEPFLFRKKNQERIPIQKELFRIGRDSSFVDYVIRDNKFIGHVHCHILSRGGEYFLVDDNSKNHTYLDGVMLVGSVENKISHGQIIKLPDEEFEFKIY